MSQSKEWKKPESEDGLGNWIRHPETGVHSWGSVMLTAIQILFTKSVI